jgi:hypothetical protein
MSYECACLVTHVWLIADMLYARDGSGVYITVGCRLEWIRTHHMDKV